MNEAISTGCPSSNNWKSDFFSPAMALPWESRTTTGTWTTVVCTLMALADSGT